MGAVFSGSSSGSKSSGKVAVITSVDRTILDLKNSRDRLQRYRTKLELELDRLVEQAKRAKQQGRTETALGLLRLRHFQREQLTNCENQLFNVMQLVETIGSRQHDTTLLAAMRVGKDTLQQLHTQTTVEDILTLMETIQEEHEVEKEISDIIAQNVPQLSADAEMEVEQELADLEASSSSSMLLPSLPVAPNTKLPEIKTPPIATTTTTPATAAATKKPARVAVPG